MIPHIGRYVVTIIIATIAVFDTVAEVKWLSESYDFGTFLEANGPKTGSVKFVNIGPDHTIINSVRPSCGCTGETHTEDIINPGDTAVINFTYNPVGRPGRFEKTVRVYYGEENALKTIPIRGTVIGTPETLKYDYPVEAGGLRLSEPRIKAGGITYGKSRNLFLKGYNQSNDTISPVWECDNPALSIGISTPQVLPGDVVSFSLYFNSREIREPGPVSIPIKFKANKNEDDAIIITFVADIFADTSGISPLEVKKGPRINVLPTLLDIGIIKGDKILEREITVTNEGESELNIKRIYCDSDGIRASKYPTKIKAGKKNKITVKIDPTKLKNGPQALMLDIYSDDPVHPVKGIRIALDKE
ncbi:MAG: DUF1573 domain-containing protein [Prevotella sp.]|nr:DUF1573 domain-containing protein [Bacteroides sp.]MCM1367056.1 DUF1573 domain-containing protein [Prevotella sp.]MCM1437045.1 DUF1573 domain-containing protein [Prevotella sp.]